MAPDPFSVESSIVVITGALGQLGRRFTRALLDRGASVAALDLGPALTAGGDAFADHDAGDRLACIAVDVTDRASLEAALTEVRERWGPPTGLVNAAAIDAPPDAAAADNGPFELYSEASWRRVIDVNVTGVFLSCQVFGAAMATAGQGSIVNISSIYGVVSPDQGLYAYRRARGDSFYKPIAYSASKSALINLTRYLATYWARAGVRVNTLTLGGVFNEQDEEFVRAYSARTPLGRMADPDEYSAAVIFLLSQASSYRTGSNLVMDGGWTAW